MTTRSLDYRPIDLKDIPKSYRRPRTSKYQLTLAEFVKCGAAAVEVDVELMASPSSAVHMLRKHAKRMKLEDRVAVIGRQGRVFLVRVKS